MILTTAQQAQNFALFVLQSNESYEALDQATLEEYLEADIDLVFGTQTFTRSAMDEVIRGAIQAFEEAY